MATLEHDITPSKFRGPTSDRLRHAIDAAVAGHPEYPNGATFVAADMPGLGAVVARHMREHRPIVLVYADGVEVLVYGREPGPAGRLRTFIRRGIRHL